MPDFSDLRQAALVALVATLPSRAAPWCAKQFFAGDYGLAQRAVLLVALGMGARELAALDPPPRTPAAPSLPPKVAAIWSGKAPQKSPKHLQLSEDATVASLAAQLQSTLLKPLRTRVFSSRMEVAQRTAAPAANPLASCVATAFVLPLTGYFQISGKDSAGRAPTSSSAVLLALFVDTLSIVVQAAGAGVPELREVAGEVLGVLLGLRRVAEREGRVCEAVLVGLLTVLEVLVGAWGGRRVADELGEEVGEAGDWVAGIWEGLEGEKKGAAAGVLRLVGEVGDGWRRGLFGGLGVQD